MSLTSPVLGAALVVAGHLVLGTLPPRALLAWLLRPYVHTLHVADLVAAPTRPGDGVTGVMGL